MNADFDIRSLTNQPVSLATAMAECYPNDMGSPVPPIYQTSLFTFKSYDELVSRFREEIDHPFYSRVDNPTVREFERLFAIAEGADRSAGFASGIAAVAAAILATVKQDDRIICVRNIYPDTYRFLERVMTSFGVTTTYHSASELENNPSIYAGVKLVVLESPVSVTFDVVDITKVAAHAKAHGAVTMIDNSWATPVNQLPLLHGIDLVVHSASKYISGHSDTVAGVVSGSHAMMKTVVDTIVPLFGAKLGPLDAWLLVRGLRTLDLRMERHGKSAAIIADRLANHPLIRKVNFARGGSTPSLKGSSGLLSFEMGEKGDIRSFCNAFQIVRLGVSWGGFETILFPTKAGQQQKSARNSLNEFGVSENLIRLSVGLENAEELWADIEQALSKSRL
jgi:cystathionine beta-lyase/cystathionine gamma-synthase